MLVDCPAEPGFGTLPIAALQPGGDKPFDPHVVVRMRRARLFGQVLAKLPYSTRILITRTA